MGNGCKQPVSDGQSQRLKIFKNERHLQTTANLGFAAIAAFHCSLFSKIEVQTAW
jgi:hypothetical protein